MHTCAHARKHTRMHNIQLTKEHLYSEKVQIKLREDLGVHDVTELTVIGIPLVAVHGNVLHVLGSRTAVHTRGAYLYA